MRFLKDLFRFKDTPQIIIQYGRLIDPIFTFYCLNNPELKSRGWNDWQPPSKEEVKSRIKEYRATWSKYNLTEKISICLGLSFQRNVIDVFIVSGISRSSSHPIIIRSGFRPDEFVVTLAHELIHRILTINAIPRITFDQQESDTTNNHIIVFAVLKEILNQDLWIVAGKKASEHSTDEYSKAISVVDKIGADGIIKMVRASQT